MDFGLTDEQRSIVQVTRAFVERELYPHEEEVERTGVLRPELARADPGEGDHGRAVRREHARGGRRRRLRHGHLGAVREGARPGQLRAALTASAGPRTSCWPAPRRSGSATSIPSVRGERRDCLAMTEPDAGSDLRAMRTRAVRDGDGWRIRGTKHFISHAQRVRLRDPVRRHRPRRGRRRPQGDVDVPGRPRHARSCRARRLPQRLAPRLHQRDPRLRRLLGARRRAARRGGQGVRPGRHLAGQHPAPGRRHLPGPGGAGARPRGPARRRAGAVRAEDRPLPGHLLQARRHGHRAAGGRAAHARRGLEVRPGPRRPTPTSRWPRSRPPRCWRWWPTRRSRSTAGWG